MKKYRWLTVLLILALGLTACTEPVPPEAPTELQASEEASLPTMSPEAEASLEALRQDLRADGVMAGIIYLGCHEGEAMDYAIYEMQEPYLEWNWFLAEIPYENYLKAEGNELYALIPTDPDAAVAVEVWDDEAGTPGDLLYDGLGEPLLLQGNISDIMPNLSVTIEDSEGNVLSAYHPFLSLRDGRVALPDDPRMPVSDMTQYEIFSMDQYSEHTMEEGITYFDLFIPNEEYTALEPIRVGMEYIDENEIFSILLDRHVIPDPVVLNSFRLNGKDVYLDLSEYFGPYIQGCDDELTYLLIGSIVNSYLSAYQAETVSVTVEGGMLPLSHGDFDGGFCFFPLEPVPFY